VTSRELELRARIMRCFAETGAPPEVDDRRTLAALAEAHVVALDGAGAIRMAHPFAAQTSSPPPPRVDAGGRTWWGSCAWDGLGIVAALGLRDATVTSGGLTTEDDVVFHVEVPARDWWADIGHT
jgi:hypothetical protein